jgi:hypothetical protein
MNFPKIMFSQWNLIYNLAVYHFPKDNMISRNFNAQIEKHNGTHSSA